MLTIIVLDVGTQRSTEQFW